MKFQMKVLFIDKSTKQIQTLNNVYKQIATIILQRLETTLNLKKVCQALKGIK